MRRRPWILLLPLAVASCGYVDAYEEAVHDMEPAYCYQTIGGVTCFRTPYHRDGARLVNYFGPHPSRYDPPDPPELAPLRAPPEVNYWVKDAEPIPRPAPTAARQGELPWLGRPLAPTPVPAPILPAAPPPVPPAVPLAAVQANALPAQDETPATEE